MKKINRMIAKVEIAVGVTITTSIVLLVFLAALTRTIRHPIIWSVDFAQLLFVWMSMIGADVALKYKAHIGVDLLVKRLPAKVQKIIEMLTYILASVFIGFVIYWGATLCINNVLRQYQTLHISYSYSTAAVPVIGILMLFTMAEQIVELIKNWNSPITDDSLKEYGGIQSEE